MSNVIDFLFTDFKALKMKRKKKLDEEEKIGMLENRRPLLDKFFRYILHFLISPLRFRF